MDNKLKFFSGLLLGLTSTTAVYGDTTYPLLRGSDIDRLRGDVKKVGDDFNNVINRENAKEAYRQRQ